MKGFCVHQRSGMKENFLHVSSTERSGKLFRSKNWPEVVRIDIGVGAIPPFEIDVVAARKRVRFDTKASGAEADEKVEGRKEL